METKRARTDRLETAYLEHGPSSGPAALLLHGFPGDARAWREVRARRTASPVANALSRAPAAVHF